MASLTGSSVASSYKDLLQVSNSNSGIDGTARVVSDGEDTASKLFLDTSRVGVGIAPTEGTLHVHTATAGSITADGAADDLVVENSGAGGITILTPNNALGQLAFGSPADAYGAFIGWKSDDNQMTIATANAGDSIVLQTANKVAALTINSSQVLELTSGQLKFPASQNASSDANTLDDYEEGDHTATIVGSTSGNYVLDSTNNVLRYTKIGRLVNIQGLLLVSSDNSASGTLRISLPFTIGDGTGLGGRSYGSGYLDSHGGTIAGQVNTKLAEGNAYFILVEVADNGSPTDINDSQVDGAFNIGVNFSYTV